MQYAIQFDDIETLLHIISSGYDVNKLFDNTLEYPLALATREGSIRSIKTILDAGADPNKTDMHGKNALHVAIWRKSEILEAIKLLIDSGADPTRANISGRSPQSHPLVAQVVREKRFQNRKYILLVNYKKRGILPTEILQMIDKFL